MAETRENRIKRMRFQCHHRGIQEMDHIMGPFADAQLEAMSDEQLDRMDALMMEFDGDVLRWLMGTSPPPAEFDNDVLALLREFKQAMGTKRA